MQISILSGTRYGLLRVLSLLPLAVAFVTSGVLTSAQVRHKPFVLVNLNEHKPIPYQHLLLYAGATPEQVRRHLAPVKLVTDAQGRTSLKLDPGMHWFQIWADGYSGCSKPPDLTRVSHSSVLFDEEIIVSNTCSPALMRLAPDDPILPPVVA